MGKVFCSSCGKRFDADKFDTCPNCGSFRYSKEPEIDAEEHPGLHKLKTRMAEFTYYTGTKKGQDRLGKFSLIILGIFFIILKIIFNS